MTDAEILKEVKSALLITTDHFDSALNIHIRDVKDVMLKSGVPQSVIESNVSVGVITRGVADLWNNGSGNISLSPYFYQRVSQLALFGDGGV